MYVTITVAGRPNVEQKLTKRIEFKLQIHKKNFQKLAQIEQNYTRLYINKRNISKIDSDFGTRKSISLLWHNENWRRRTEQMDITQYLNKYAEEGTKKGSCR